MHDVTKALDFPTESAALKVRSQSLQLVAPARGVSANDRAVRDALSKAFALAEVDLLCQAGARVAAGVSHQRPAHRRVGLAVVVNVLFGHVRVVPHDFLVESAGLRVMFELNDLRSHDPCEPV